MSWDCIVVGASFGGAMTALTIREKSHLKVLMLERKEKIGSPVNTTGGVAKFWLDRIGLNPPKETIAAELHGVEIIVPSGDIFSLKRPETIGYVFYPTPLNKWLVGKALDHGAELLTGSPVEYISWRTDLSKLIDLKTPGGWVGGHIIVGADGAASRIGKWAGLTEDLPAEDQHIGYEIVVENKAGQDPRVIRLWFGREVAPLGYAWSFPEDGRLRVGVGVPTSVGRAPKHFLDRFLETHPEYKGQVFAEEGGIIPTAQPLESAIRGNILLVGDAARVCVPSTGGGIQTALLMGKVAGETIAENDLEHYDKRWKKELYRFLKVHYAIKKAIYGWSDEDMNEFLRILKTYKIKSLDPRVEVFRVFAYVARKKPRLIPKMLRVL